MVAWLSLQKRLRACLAAAPSHHRGAMPRVPRAHTANGNIEQHSSNNDQQQHSLRSRKAAYSPSAEPLQGLTQSTRSACGVWRKQARPVSRQQLSECGSRPVTVDLLASKRTSGVGEHVHKSALLEIVSLIGVLLLRTV